MKSTRVVCVVLLLAYAVTSTLSSPILNPFQLFGEMFRNMMQPPHGSVVSSMGYSHVYNNNNAAGAPAHHAPPSISSSITTSVQLTQSLGGDQTGGGGGHVYSQQSRPYLDWEKHVLGQGGGRLETVPATTEPPAVTTELSFPDYIRRATYDWMKKYKLAYFAQYYQTPGPSTSPTARDPPPTTPKTTSTTSATTPTTSPANTTTTLNTTETIENTTTAASEPLSTTAVPTTESSTPPSSTTTPSTTTSATTTTKTSTTTTSTTTTSTTTTRPTIRSTTPTTTALRPIAVIDQAVDDMTGGFLPDQPNLGTRWAHHHIEHTVDNLI